MKRFTVKQLRNILSGAEDDAVVLVSNGDHGYIYAYAEVTTALVENQAYGFYTEDHGEEFTPEAEYGKRVPAVIIG